MDKPDLAPAKLLLSKTSDIERFEVALNDKRIMLAPGDSLKEAIRGVIVMVGVRPENIPQGQEKEILLGFIVENYGGHTLSEIRLAFTLAISGKLDLPLRDVKCYENFSPLYFASIMEAYRRWAMLQHEILRQIPPPAYKYTDEDKKQIDFEYACAVSLDYWRKLQKLKAPLKTWQKQL